MTPSDIPLRSKFKIGAVCGLVLLFLLELILAATWGYVFGIIFPLICLGLAAGWFYRHWTGLKECKAYKETEDNSLQEEGARPQSLARKIASVVHAIALVFTGLWIFMMVVVHLSAPDPSWENPSDLTCPEVTENCYHQNRTFPGKTQSELQAQVKCWVGDLGSSTVLFENGAFIHARVLTLLIGFPDDFATVVVGSEVFALSRSRLGKSDFGVNKARLDRFWSGFGDCKS